MDIPNNLQQRNVRRIEENEYEDIIEKVEEYKQALGLFKIDVESPDWKAQATIKSKQLKPFYELKKSKGFKDSQVQEETFYIVKKRSF